MTFLDLDCIRGRELNLEKLLGVEKYCVDWPLQKNDKRRIVMIYFCPICDKNHDSDRAGFNHLVNPKSIHYEKRQDLAKRRVMCVSCLEAFPDREGVAPRLRTGHRMIPRIVKIE